MLYIAPVPILVGLCALGLYWGLIKKKDLIPFLASLGFFILSFISLCFNFYPYIVPPSVTIWDAAAPDNSLSFLLTGSAVLLPLTLIYSGYSYWVFRGKVDATKTYH
ncbi:cytochrome d ubiquinol oxidase subunit II [Candidatus Nitrotoga sp. HW29]|uniref:cytochrome d ubiquinol oxidase subunit II n=1 Tax=Candidatus Nitrotoga sp. HW29 TaxID=2886963 RepID=UPI00403DE9D8